MIVHLSCMASDCSLLSLKKCPTSRSTGCRLTSVFLFLSLENRSENRPLIRGLVYLSICIRYSLCQSNGTRQKTHEQQRERRTLRGCASFSILLFVIKFFRFLRILFGFFHILKASYSRFIIDRKHFTTI